MARQSKHVIYVLIDIGPVDDRKTRCLKKVLPGILWVMSFASGGSGASFGCCVHEHTF